MKPIAIIGGLMLCPAPALADTITLDFASEACAVADPDSLSQVGPISYTNHNLFLYGECGPRIVLGDDGFAQNAEIFTTDGTLFSLDQFDIMATHRIYRLPIDAFFEDFSDGLTFGYPLIDAFEDFLQFETRYPVSPELIEDYAYFSLTGFRDGRQIAERTFDPQGLSVVTGDGEFEDLDRLEFQLTLSGFESYGEDGYIIGCRLRCGYAEYDNVVLRLSEPADDVALAAVSLPASAMLLVSGLAVLGARRRFN